MQSIKNNLKEYFNLNRDKVQDTEAVESIIMSTTFKGASLWILVAAIFIASLGLNMNSTAVIIGAMLISPLMGPIMGIGLGLAINDTPLFHRCLKNLFVATLIALLTSTLYFWISPLNDARSELLARTQPTLYDVLIAFFGGFAGIIATGTKSKGNILPGVAIATALMPPLCTAGYGLATLQWNFFFGAFYLYIINTVYIGIATWVGCYLLRLPKVNAPVNPRYRMGITMVLLLLVIIPSGFTTVRLIQDDVRDARIAEFARKEFQGLPNTQVISCRYVESDSTKVIEVALLGDKIDEQTAMLISGHMPLYHLPEGCKLKLVQGSSEQSFDAVQFSGSIIQTVIQTYQDQIMNLQKQNDSLRLKVRELESIQTQESLPAPSDTINVSGL